MGVSTKRRVVVTGLGMISPLANDVDGSWKAVLSGKSGVGHIAGFDSKDFNVHIAAEVKDFDPKVYMPAKDVRRNDVFIQYGVAAVAQAMRDSGLQVTDNNAGRVGVALGSGIGGLPMIEYCRDLLSGGGPRKLSPFFIPGVIINLAAGYVSIQHNLKGPNISIVTACTTGTHNIGMAARMIAYGDADVMVCGGTEMATSPLGVGGFSAMKALSTRNDAPEKASRPWDKDRDGFVLGSGAGALILEEYDMAKKRGANIYAELVGLGMSGDAYHITSPAPEGDGGRRAMQAALEDAEINPDEIGYINAHATSTLVGDDLELMAIKNMFKGHAYELAVSSTKSMTGHLLGAAGAIEAIFSILALRDQVVPPTINLDNPSEEADLNLVAHHAQESKLNVVMSNSFGFGGTNASVIFKKID
ncbi:MAG: beta-ketoacyl-ACP synthase II [Pseudomonadota bacterium]